MAKVHFHPDNKNIEVENGITILEAARLAGLVIESPCNGSGTCGKCKVKLDSTSLLNIIQSGRHHLSTDEEAEGFVLSCEAQIIGDISVEIINNKIQNSTLKVLSHGKSFDIELATFVKKKYSNEGNTTTIYAGDEILGYEKGDTSDKNYGVVVDIGTTTLVTSIVNLNTGIEIDSASSLNPQSIHAQDVLSRIKFASEETGLKTMHTEFIKEINRMIGEVSSKSGINLNNIYEIIFSGNTCMLHLATNVNPGPMGKYPYKPQVRGGNHIKAANFKLEVSEVAIIYLPPIISAYVGADITSGVLASKLHEQEGVTLFVDIGTNGEMVIGVDGDLSATSTAAGPAFEGMNITCGMRAGNGAIELFNIEEDGSIIVKTIGDAPAIGICGSGLLDIVGELVAYGVINKNGKMVDPEKADILPTLKERLVKNDGKIAFKVTENVFLTQKDIRQVQLAKGAVRAGIEFLLRDKGIKPEDVDKVLIAGSFGYHLRAKSLVNIGLLPEAFLEKIDFIGNTSKTGGQALLLNDTYRKQMEGVVENIEVLELANYQDFDKVFVQCLGF